MRALQLLFSVVAVWAALVSPALALTPHETWIVAGPVEDREIAEWSKMPGGARSYLFQLQDPDPWDLDPIAHLAKVDRIQISVTRFPAPYTVEAYRKLALKGAELVGFGAGIPSDGEIALLNRIGFARITLLLLRYPEPADAARLAKIQAPLQITFSATFYPRFVDKPGLLAIPAQVPLQYINDFWPWYQQMDNLNLLPHAHTLRVTGIYPSDAHYLYLRQIKNLREIIVETDYAPEDPKTWEKMGPTPVRWTYRHGVPSAQALQAFESSAQATGNTRKLVIDSDDALTPEQLQLLERSLLPVEWIHAAPRARR